MNDRAWQGICPVDVSSRDEQITLAHGEGGRLMRRLIRERIVARLGGEVLAEMNDAARLPTIDGPVAFTTDSFVVSPLFFPGGDIGSLAVFGTVNDLAVSGARPRWLSLSLILEEGLPIAVLDRVLQSIAGAAERAAVQVVTGDTKVVARGAADGLFINTAGLGELIPPVPPGAAALRPADELLVSGPIGRHGIAVLACRENLGFDPPPRSDCAPLIGAVELLRQADVPVRALRDATRGGVAAVLHEWAEQSRLTLAVHEASVPVSPDVRGACELLGLDPLHVANEGTMLIAVAAGAGPRTLSALRRVPACSEAALVGQVQPRGIAPVTVRRALGIEQALDEPLGSPLPRIC
jgi:hydrogenase expression/formation protein HypE